MIVTIDGPAAAGKSTAARTLAERLGFEFLDTGAMYRAVALAALRRGLALDDEQSLGLLAASVRIHFRGRAIFLDDEDVSEAIRDPAVTRASRHVADVASVRHHMVSLQRDAAAGVNIVTEGRDQGTVVFPDAACKFFLTAQPQVRAQRRHQEMIRRGQSVTVEQVLADQAERDDRDARRAIAPMVPAADAIVFDTSTLPFDQVVDELEQHVRRVQQQS